MICHSFLGVTHSSSCVLCHHRNQGQYQLCENFGVLTPPQVRTHTTTSQILTFIRSGDFFPSSRCQLAHTSSSCVLLHDVCCLLPLFFNLVISFTSCVFFFVALFLPLCLNFSCVQHCDLVVCVHCHVFLFVLLLKKCTQMQHVHVIDYVNGNSV